MKKNGLFTFVTACIPGFGQMYYGYMRRGVSLALGFWGIAFLSTIALGIFAFILPVVWAYAFFDTYNIRNLTAEQRAMFRDDYLPGGDFKIKAGLSKLFNEGRGSRWFGIALIVAGVLVIYNLFINKFYWRLEEMFPLLSYIFSSLPALLIAGVLIYFGLRIIRGQKQSAPPPADDYDYYYSQQFSGQPGAEQSPWQQAAQQPEQCAQQPEPPMPEVDRSVVLEVQPGADALGAHDAIGIALVRGQCAILRVAQGFH